MKRFMKITDGLFRGSAPTEKEVAAMNRYIGIKKIVSLDRKTGESIRDICKSLGIEHIIIPLNGRKAALADLLSKDLHNLLMNDGPTFIHCLEGKDRTGFVSAMFRCLYMGWTFEEAIREAKKLGFGKGVSPFIVSLYTNALKKVCKSKDSNTLDDGTTIVSNVRSYKDRGDGRGSMLDQATQGSFAPYLSRTRQYPYDLEYNTINDQSPTRQNYGLKPILQDLPEGSVDIPLVGLYDSNAGVKGVGPGEPVGGFITT